MQTMKRTTAAVPPPPKEKSDPSPRPNLVGLGSTAVAQSGLGKAPQLLQQMELMMKTWDQSMEAARALEDDAEELQAKVFQLEACRSILALFTSGSGPYQPILSKLFMYLFELIENLLQEVDELKAEAADRKGALQPVVEEDIGSDYLRIEDKKEVKRVDYAFGRVRKAEDEMKSLVAESNASKAELQAKIDELQRDKRRLQELIEFQASRARRNRIEGHLTEEQHEKRILETVKQLSHEEEVAKIKQQLEESEMETEAVRKRLKAAETLNGKYAIQTVQMAARVRVYHEHNERFATLLSMQYDERAATERENELLRSELMDLNKFHQLRHNLEGETGSIGVNADLRTIRYGLGNNVNVPRHLHHSSLMNRITLPKEAALSLVTDLLTTRGSQGRRTDFHTFIHNYLTKKHGADAVAWAYSLDDACRLNDADPNLNMFWLVSRRVLAEDLYSIVHTDILIFLEACEAVDQMQHGELRLTVPIAHVLGILLELFPSYPDGAFRRAMEQLQTTLTTNAHAHYRLLFPNLEREEVSETDAFSHVDLRSENGFSKAFKELIIDDAVVTMQLIEDALLHQPGDRLSLGDCTSAVLSVFDNADVAREVSAIVRKIVREEMLAGGYEMSVPKPIAVNALRQHVVIRRGVFRNETSATTSHRLQMANAAMAEWANVTGEELVRVNYRDVIQTTATRRPEISVEESDESDVEFDATQQ